MAIFLSKWLFFFVFLYLNFVLLALFSGCASGSIVRNLLDLLYAVGIIISAPLIRTSCAPIELNILINGAPDQRNLFPWFLEVPFNDSRPCESNYMATPEPGVLHTELQILYKVQMR